MKIILVLCTLCILIVKLTVANLSALEPRIKYPSSKLNSLDELIDFSKYHHYNDLTEILKFTHLAYPNLTYMYSIGKSVQGRELWVMKLSTNPSEVFNIEKPSVKLVANIHGNEPVGRELLLHLMKYILSNYATDNDIWNLLINTDIHLLFSMNPDGFENSVEGECDGVRGRHNANGYDLNRNFHDYFSPSLNLNTQPETRAIQTWLQSIPFTLSASLHGGALVASYPFDNVPDLTSHFIQSKVSIAPDDDVFRFLSLAYSENHLTMSKGLPCRSGDKSFPNGITNGAEWYVLKGGMQDYNYIYHGCMELTLELSCCKYPMSYELQKYWQHNQRALIEFIRQAHRGIYGTVRDKYGNPVPNATLMVRGRKISFRTNSAGEFRRILLPGKYILEVIAHNFKQSEYQFVVGANYQPSLIEIILEASQNSYPKPLYRPILETNGQNNFFESFKNKLSSMFTYFE